MYGFAGVPYHRIIGYAYESDLHCENCASERFNAHTLEHTDYRCPECQKDREGNTPSAEMAGYESDSCRHCGDCFEPLTSCDCHES